MMWNYSYYTNDVDVKEQLTTFYKLLANVVPKTELKYWQVSGCGIGYMFNTTSTERICDLVNFYLSSILVKGEQNETEI